MDRILAVRAIPLGANPKHDATGEVVAMSRWLALEAARRAGRTMPNIDGDDRFLAMLFAVVAANHLSRLANVFFEAPSTLACCFVDADLGGKLGQADIKSFVDTYNAMCEHPEHTDTIRAAGTQVAAFFSTNHDKYLENLGRLFAVLRQDMQRPLVSK
jgi:hypothetical protein